MDINSIRLASRSSYHPTLERLCRQVDPLDCPKCGAPMHVIALIDDAEVIRRILEHLGRWAPRQARQSQRAPPRDTKGIDGSKPPVRELTSHPVPDIT